MKRPLTVVVLATIGGLHCASADIDDDDAIELATSADEGLEHVQRRPPQIEAPAERGSSARAMLGNNRNSEVTSTVSAEDGSRFIAGVFSGTIRVGDFVLTSRGGDDVFIVHALADGTIDWAKAVGSKQNESAPRLTFDAGRLKLLAMTKGSVDCGFGPLLAWSSETFFLCTFDAAGKPQNGGAFPTGRR